MQVAIFLCSNETMGECLERQLFGTGEAYGKLVRRGDLLFLYNFSERKLYGLWTAQTDSGMFNARAWGGRYKNQVRVTQASKVMIQVPRYCLVRILGDAQNWGQMLRGHKAQNLLQYFSHDYASEVEFGVALLGPEEDYRTRHPANFFCEDGHRVRSTHEKIIDDWLYRRRIPHAYEAVLALPGQLIPDFVVHRENGEPVYVEYWGVTNDPTYQARRLHKSKLYADYRLPLIELYPEDLHSVDVILPKRLGKWGVSF